MLKKIIFYNNNNISRGIISTSGKNNNNNNNNNTINNNNNNNSNNNNNNNNNCSTIIVLYKSSFVCRYVALHYNHVTQNLVCKDKVDKLECMEAFNCEHFLLLGVDRSLSPVFNRNQL